MHDINSLVQLLFPFLPNILIPKSSCFKNISTIVSHYCRTGVYISNMVPWWGVAAGENEVRIKQIENKGNGREGKKDNYIINGVKRPKK